MSEKPVPCLHCAIVETINKHLVDHGLQVQPGSDDALRLHAQISAHLMNTIHSHIEDDDGLSGALRREAWRSILRWALTGFLEHTTAADLVAMFTKAAAEAADTKTKH